MAKKPDAPSNSGSTIFGWLLVGGAFSAIVWYAVKSTQTSQAQRLAALAGLQGSSGQLSLPSLNHAAPSYAPSSSHSSGSSSSGGSSSRNTSTSGTPASGSSNNSVNTTPDMSFSVEEANPGTDFGSVPSYNAGVEVSTTADLLRRDARARKIFLFQAAMYSYLNQDQIPDGIMGPLTQPMITSINDASGNASASPNWSDNVLKRLAPGMKVILGVSDLSQASARVLPFDLPRDLVNQINADGLAVAADVPLLQIYA